MQSCLLYNANDYYPPKLKSVYAKMKALLTTCLIHSYTSLWIGIQEKSFLTFLFDLLAPHYPTNLLVDTEYELYFISHKSL